MGKAGNAFLFVNLLFCLLGNLNAQPVANFTLPDSTCVGAPVNIINNSTGGTTYGWSFCSGNASNVPLATNIGNPSNNMYQPVYITLVQDGNDCFSFITNQGAPTHITRNYHGANFRNNPLSTASILQTGILHHFVEAIQIKNDNGNWYGFVNNNTTILRLNFGNSLWNTPTTTDIGPFPNIAVAHGLIIIKDGNTWLGFFDSDTQNKLYRLNFGSSLTNIPTFEDLGNVAGFSHPCQIALVKENGLYYIMAVNNNSSSISRVFFGNSLLNTPTGQNLGNCGAVVTPNGITMLNDCQTTTGYYTVYQAPAAAAIGRLDFTGGVSGTVTAQSLGNLGNLYYPHSFSEIFRQNDSLFVYLTNRDNATLTRYSFPPINGASVLTSTSFTPPSYFYTQTGTFHVRLVINEGLADETTLCKNIVVVAPPTVELGPDHSICPGQTTTLDAGPGYSAYLWSTGATTRAITVSTAGNYSVTVTRAGCQATDNVNVITTTCATADFTLPDSSCVGVPINITNLSTGGSTYYWNFCSGNFINTPVGINIGNPGGLLNIPTYPTLAKDGNTCYSFISCQGIPGVVRYNHGNSFKNNPSSWTNLGSFGVLTSAVEGIQIKYDGGQWYGFVNNNTSMVRLNFGNSLANTPTATTLGPYPQMQMGHGMLIYKEGSTWICFVTCSTGQKLLRFNFGNSLSNTPVLEDLGNLGVLVSCGQMALVFTNNQYHIFIADNGGVIRVDFGSSLLNTPSATSAGTFGAGSIVLLRDCDLTTGYFSKYQNPGVLGRLNFPNGILGNITSTILGNIGNLNLPHSFTEVFRASDTLFMYLTNRGNGTLTRYYFPPCSNASIPPSNLFTPPPFFYSQPGIYNVSLVVNEGLPDQANLCKTIVISPAPVVDLGNDRTICQGDSVILDAGSGFSSYLWSNGATTRKITVFTSGIYSVTVTQSGCSATDQVTVNVISLPVVALGADTSICQGTTVTFDAGLCPGCTYLWKDGSGTTVGTDRLFTTGTAGTYHVVVTSSSGCTASDTVALALNNIQAVQVVIVASDTDICSGSNVTLNALTQHAGTAPGFQWQVDGVNAGSNSPAFSFNPTVTSQVRCILTSSQTVCVTNNPDTSNLITVHVTPVVSAFIDIAGKSSGICDGEQVQFQAVMLNGGTNPVFQWQVNGINTGGNTSSITLQPADNDVIRCILTSSVPRCILNNPAVSDTIVTRVYPLRTAGISITPSQTRVCSGTMVTFTATPQHPGPAPVYQWTVNGIPAGGNQPVFTWTPADQDIIGCTLTASDTLCLLNNPAIAIPVTMTVDPLLPVSVTVAPSGNPVCAGTAVSFSATPLNGGTTPHFQWMRNGNPVGSDNSVYSCIPLNNDVVSCILTSSETCTLNSLATSNTITMIVMDNPQVTLPACFDTLTYSNASPIILRGGIPYGGIYQGIAVSSGIFNPALAGPGTHTITYSYTNVSGCQASASVRIHTLVAPAFICGNSFTDPRDNRQYSTIRIGSQCWMRENLNYGTSLTGILTQRDNCIPEKYCYNDQLLSCVPLYQWDEVMQYETASPAHGLCPPGWHIPSESEWTILFSNWTNEAFAGSPLKYSGYSGYLALLTGSGFQNTIWKYDNWATFFWSSDSPSVNKAWAHAMNEVNYSVARYPSAVSNAFSVRCIKD